MELHPDYKELLELLNKHSVEYVIAGGYALAFHGAPRFTGDIDIAVKPNRDNAKKILEALKEFGFGGLDLSEEDFSKPENVIQFGVPPVRIDIITSLSGLSWDEIEAGMIKHAHGDIQVFYIGKKEFIQNKQKTGRANDLADIEALGDQTE